MFTKLNSQQVQLQLLFMPQPNPNTTSTSTAVRLDMHSIYMTLHHQQPIPPYPSTRQELYLRSKEITRQGKPTES